MLLKKIAIISAVSLLIYSSLAYSIEKDDSIPIINHVPITTATNIHDLKVTATIENSSNLKNIVLMYRPSGEIQYKSLDMTSNDNINYIAFIPKQDLVSNKMEYYIRVSDGKNIITTIKDSNPIEFEVFLEDIESPNISFLTPYNGQEHIVGKPKIEAILEDSSNIDKYSIKLFVNYKDVTSNCTITDTSISYVPTKKFKRGSQIVRLEMCDNSPQKNKNITEWYFNVGSAKYNHYYGQLHAHTSASDGKGTYAEAYTMARDEANLDFFAITEHSHMLDNHLDSNIKNASTSKEWANLIKVSKQFTVEDKFLALYGYEMTYNHKVEPKIGHINTFNTTGFESRDKSNMDLKNYYKILSRNSKSISQLNHPGSKFGDFNELEYDESVDDVITLLEIGNGYNKDLKSEKNSRAFDQYQKALDNGWHVAPTNNQDNHRYNWGIANSFRTVILSSDLNTNAIYDSIKNMRVYCTEDRNIKIDYTINDNVMGSTLQNPSKLNFNISAIDNDYNDKIKKIEIISNKGAIVNSKEFNSNLAKWDLTLPLKEGFYYVKVTQSDGGVSVTAPIWVEFDKDI